MPLFLLNIFILSLLTGCLLTRPKENNTSSEIIETPKAGVSPFRHEILMKDTMSFDGRDLNVAFFLDPAPNPKYGILWMDGEIMNLKYERESFDQWSESERQEVIHFVEKFNDDSELRLLYDRTNSVLVKPWYGDWQPLEQTTPKKIPIADKPNWFLWLSKNETDYALLEQDNEMFLLKYDAEANSTSATAETPATSKLRWIFENEDTDLEGKKIEPTIVIETTLPEDDKSLPSARILKMPEGAFSTSAERVFNLGQN